MKKMILRKKNQPNQEPLAEANVSNLTLRKLTLKTGVKAGLNMGNVSIVGSCEYPTGNMRRGL